MLMLWHEVKVLILLLLREEVENLSFPKAFSMIELNLCGLCFKFKQSSYMCGFLNESSSLRMLNRLYLFTLLVKELV